MGMINEKIKNHDECNVDEKEVIDNFRKMRLMYDYLKSKLYQYHVEDLINDYENLINCLNS